MNWLFSLAVEIPMDSHPAPQNAGCISGLACTSISLDWMEAAAITAITACALLTSHHVVATWSLSCVWLSVTPWTAACQAPLSMGFPRQGDWSGLPFPPPGDLPAPRDQTHVCCTSRQILYHLNHQESPPTVIRCCQAHHLCSSRLISLPICALRSVWTHRHNFCPQCSLPGI